IHVLPTLWFRNTWSWDFGAKRPRMSRGGPVAHSVFVQADHPDLGGAYRLYCSGEPEVLFTENESNLRRLFNVENTSMYVKDAFHEYLIQGHKSAVNPVGEGTKAAPHYRLTIEPGESAVVRLRLSGGQVNASPFGRPFDEMVAQRQREADEFYAT